MSIKGSSVHKKIKAKVGEVETQSNSFAAQLYKIEGNLDKLTVEREEFYVKLASHYLPELEADSIKETLKDIREEIENVFREKQERRSTIEKLMKENRAKNDTLENEIERTATQIEQEVQEKDKILAKINEDLKKDVEYTAKDEEAKKAQARLQQYQKRVAEIEEEAQQKIPDFERNKIFSYLVKTGYGTEEYQRNGMRKRLDSWAAEKVDFAGNKRRYDFLKSMPEMMKTEVTKRQGELEGIVKQMKTIESKIEKQYGLPEFVEDINKSKAKKQALIEKDKKLDEQYAGYTKEREEIDKKKDPYYLEAVQKIKEYLKGQEISALKSKARRTKGTEDDRIVDRIEEIDESVSKLKEEAKKSKRERDAYAAKLSDLKEVERRFRNRDYDGSYSSFPSTFDVDDLLTGYILGNFSLHDINHKIDSSQTKETPSYHSSSSYSSSYSSYGSSDSGSNFGGSDSFSSGGGFDGGGFSSGDGF